MSPNTARTVVYGCTMLKGTGKTGLLKPDADGYYTVPMGAYGAYNSANMFYDLASAAKQFEQNSALMRRLRRGVLRGEYKHPERKPGMGDLEYIQRIRDIDSDRVAFHIRNVYLGQPMRDEQGRQVVPVIGEIRPSGPFGEVLKDALNNPHENVYFSVRSLTMDDLMRGIKYTKEIVTWDFVNEGGIYNANKYHSPSLESFNEVTLTPNTLWRLIDAEKEQAKLGLESQAEDYAALARSLGWHKNAPRSSTPIFVGW